MRQINWEGPLSDEDIAFLRQMGVQGMEERIAGHQEKHGADVPPLPDDEDGLTASALDASARASERVNSDNGPQLVDPTATDDEDEESTGDEPEDDYDSWKVAELEDQVSARDAMEGTTSCVPVGTGKDGKVVKADLVKALRVWDQENPDALDD